MIGDARARGKVKSTTSDRPVFNEKRPGRNGGVKTIAPSTGKDDNDSGGDHEQHAVAKRMTHGQKPGTGLGQAEKPMPTPRRTIPPRSQNDSGGRIDEWCRGKRSDYK
jgi:hypothetical protein